jgi:hypothetical protein
LLIVGIGASAGGLDAFEAFFSAMPVDEDMNRAFLVVQHLAPDHKSIFTGLLQRYTRMSLSEELATINAEFKSKALESAHLSNDMNNLVVGTGIATIFVDLKLNILRFTPGLTSIISLIEADIGRPLMHFTSSLGVYNQLEQDLQSMLHSFIPRDVAVQTKDCNYYM